MMRRAKVVPIGGPLDWRAFDIPGSSAPVSLATLHVDQASRATTSVVRFPDGWSRPGPGSYECSEEFIVLDGELEMSAQRLGPGEWVFVPPGVTRVGTVALGDVTAFARFSGPARWRDGVGIDGGLSSARLLDSVADVVPSPFGGGDARLLHRVGAVRSWVLSSLGGVVAPCDAEFLSLTDRVWSWVSLGERLPDLEAPCFCRTFSSDEGEAT